MKASKQPWRWLLWAVFTVVIAFLASRHEQWYDEYHVWSMCRDLDLAGIWRAMTEEGHFILWHLLVYPFVKAGCSFWCLQVVSVALLSAAAWLIMMRSPFSWFQLCLILFSYPMLYEFAVIARCYALIPPILFAVAALYPGQQEHPWLYCLFVGMLAHTHVFMEGMVAALFLLYLYEQVYLPYKAGKAVKMRILPSLLIVALVLLAFVQVSGSLAYGEVTFNDDRRGLVTTLRQLGGGYSLLFTSEMRELMQKDGNPLALLPVLGLSVLLLLGVLWLLYRIFWRHKENRKFAGVLLVSLGWQFLFSVKIYFFSNQRVYLPMLILFFLLWCIDGAALRKEITVLLAILFLLTARDTPITDITQSYCNDLAIYEEIVEHAQPGDTICVESDEYPAYFTMMEGTYELRYINPADPSSRPEPPYWLVLGDVLSLQK